METFKQRVVKFQELVCWEKLRGRTCSWPLWMTDGKWLRPLGYIPQGRCDQEALRFTQIFPLLLRTSFFSAQRVGFLKRTSWDRLGLWPIFKTPWHLLESHFPLVVKIFSSMVSSLWDTQKPPTFPRFIIPGHQGSQSRPGKGSSQPPHLWQANSGLAKGHQKWLAISYCLCSPESTLLLLFISCE